MQDGMAKIKDGMHRRNVDFSNGIYFTKNKTASKQDNKQARKQARETNNT